MVVALPPLLLNVVWYLLIAFSPLVALAVGLRTAKVVDAVRDRRAARRRAHEPHGPPLELLVTDLRRLRAELVTDNHTNNVRRTALLRAYDSVLRDLCVALEIPTALAAEEPYGEPRPDRELDRLLAEAAIQEAGISLHTTRRRTQP